MPFTPALSIVIPAFNEAARLGATIAALAACFAGRQVDVIVVDDGSTDATSDIAKRLSTDDLPITVVPLGRNRGKGSAVRAGVARTKGARVLIMDADLATDLGATGPMHAMLDEVDVVIGSRAIPGSTVHDSTHLRSLMGRTFNWLVRRMLGLQLDDTQCGFKMFRGDEARLLFALSRVDGFAFDPEVLQISTILGMTTVEYPVDWTATDDSKVRPIRDSIRTFRELVSIRRRLDPETIRAEARALGWTPA